MDIFIRCFILVCAFGIAQPLSPIPPMSSCPPGQVFTSCGSVCNKRCGELGQVFCTLQCFIGCECTGGKVFNAQNECVDPQDCPTPTCPEGQRYTECGSVCNKRCGELGQIICPTVCFVGCECEPGTVFNDEEDCVDPSECPEMEDGEEPE